MPGFGGFGCILLVHAELNPPSRVESIVTLIAVAIPLAWLGLIVQAYFSRSAEQQNVARGVANCRQILEALQKYRDEHQPNGPLGIPVTPAPPQPRTSNEAFRELFKANVLSDESIFGCPQSPYQPDGNHGTAPAFEEALAPGENHWMMTSGLSDSASGSVPLVYENAVTAKWNPEWNADVKAQPAPGRSWSKGIIIGFLDRSASVHALAAGEGPSVPLKNKADTSKNPFTMHGLDWEMLDVARKASP